MEVHAYRCRTTFIAKLPKAEHDAPEWQAAMEALLLVADLGGPTMFAQIGVIGRLIVTSTACSIRRARIPIGDGADWRVIDDPRLRHGGCMFFSSRTSRRSQKPPSMLG